MKILSVFGTRPEAVKMAPVIAKLKETEGIISTVCVTGQHRSMLDQVLRIFNIVPDHDLDIMQPGQTLQSITALTLERISKVLEAVQPDRVLVHGDTTTAFATALAAFYQKIPVGHVEAGLRTYNKYSPWPEEMNRTMIGRIADMHFAPTKSAADNLIKEGIEKNSIFVTGNTVIDALLQVVAKIDSDAMLQDKCRQQFDFIDPDKKLILVTAHRRENFGAGMDNICTALKKIASNNNVQIIYPVHLNPKVQDPAFRELKNCQNIFLIEPLDYVPFVYLMSCAYLILTDSGGIQEEGPSLGKPVLVMRDNTERPEAVSAGTVRVIGTKVDNIVSAVVLLLNNMVQYKKMSNKVNPYGDGEAAGKIVDYIQCTSKSWYKES